MGRGLSGRINLAGADNGWQKQKTPATLKVAGVLLDVLQRFDFVDLV